jgi:hypothetical protein
LNQCRIHQHRVDQHLFALSRGFQPPAGVSPRSIPSPLDTMPPASLGELAFQASFYCAVSGKLSGTDLNQCRIHQHRVDQHLFALSRGFQPPADFMDSLARGTPAGFYYCNKAQPSAQGTPSGFNYCKQLGNSPFSRAEISWYFCTLFINKQCSNGTTTFI